MQCPIENIWTGREIQEVVTVRFVRSKSVYTRIVKQVLGARPHPYLLIVICNSYLILSKGFIPLKLLLITARALSRCGHSHKNIFRHPN